MDALHRRERVVQMLGVISGLMLFFAFFLPRGGSAKWRFGWDEQTFRMVLEILMIPCGLVVLAVALLPVPRMMKGVLLLGLGLVLTGASTIDALNGFSDLFEQTRWMDVLLWIVFPAIAASLAFTGDSDRPGSGRFALAMVGGATMLFLAVIPITLAIPSQMQPLTAFIDIWDVPGKLEFFEFLLLCALAVVVSLGPVAGGLLMFHSGIAIASPEKRLSGAGPVAGLVFLLYQPATFFLLFLFLWMRADIVFTTYIVGAVQVLGPAFMLAAGVYWICEALAQDPNRAYEIAPGLGTLVSGRPTPAATVAVVAPPSTARSTPVPGPMPGAGAPQPAASVSGRSGPLPPASAVARSGAIPGPLLPAKPDLVDDDPGGSWPPRSPGRRTGGLPPVPDPSLASTMDPSSPLRGWAEEPEVTSGVLLVEPDEEERTQALDLGSVEKIAAADADAVELHTLDDSGVADFDDGDDSTQAVAFEQVAQIVATDKPVASLEDDTDGSTQAIDMDQIAKLAESDRRPSSSVGPGNDPAAHWEDAALAWERQDWNKALFHYGRVLEMQPTRTEAARAIADINYGLGNLDHAERFYRRVLEDWPEDQYSLAAIEQIASHRDK